VVTGFLSFFRGVGRAVDVSYSGYGPLALVNRNRGSEIRSADVAIARSAIGLVVNPETYEDFREKAQLALDYVVKNIGGLASRNVAAISTGNMIISAGKGVPYISALGPALKGAAMRADTNYLVRQGISPIYALVFSELGLTTEEAIGSIARDLFDDKKLQEFTGIKCVEGK